MQPEPQKEHQWLQKLIGEWTFEGEALMGPDQPPLKHVGTESVRGVGPYWVQCEGQISMPEGGPGTTVMTLGYDPQARKFVGSFIGSMMTNMWVYDGQLDAAGKVLTLAATGPSFTDPSKTTTFHDIVEVVSDNQRTLSSQYQSDDGAWHRFMTLHYRRKG